MVAATSITVSAILQRGFENRWTTYAQTNWQILGPRRWCGEQNKIAWNACTGRGLVPNDSVVVDHGKRFIAAQDENIETANDVSGLY